MVQADPFSPQISIADMLENWPQVIPIFIRYRLDCVGCSMAAFETLSDVIAIYDLPAEMFLSELERAIRLNPVDKETGVAKGS